MFNSGPFEASVTAYLEDHGMIENALIHLKEQITQEYARLMAKSQANAESALSYAKFSKGESK